VIRIAHKIQEYFQVFIADGSGHEKAQRALAVHAGMLEPWTLQKVGHR
jgi:hypothetical protein